MARRALAAALASIALLAIACAAACSRTPAPTGGLVVVVADDGTLAPGPDRIAVEVRSVDGATSYRDGSFSMSDAASPPVGTWAFPVTFAIDSNGDPSASVSVKVTASAAGADLESLVYAVRAIPTDAVVQLDVVFRAACAGAGESPSACCPAACAVAGDACDCSAADLPPLGADAGDASLAPPDGGSGDAGALHDAAPDAGAGADAGACTLDATQCLNDLTPQRCVAGGTWQNQPPCRAGATYCFDGACIPAPTSCAGDYGGCESFVVDGGSYARGLDPLHADAGAPATISSFRLDAFETQARRFRQFVDAVVLGGGMPLEGDGTHAYLGGGTGLSPGGDAGGAEPGWNTAWNAMFPTTIDQWNANLRCGNAATWGPTTDANDDRPINCVTWYEAYAFCIWDKGFLPSEAEWNYAAADGAEQRLYPWGSADPTIDYAIYGCLYPQATSCQDESSGNIANFGPDLGRSPFGMWNLAGNVSEWVLDVYGDYPVPCADCAALSGAAAQRVFRGGSFDRGPTDMFTSARVGADPSSRLPDVGFRCARAP